MNDLEKMRHTLSHVLAAAVQELYPDVAFGIGPAIDNGFYYDIDFGTTKISDTDLPKIEKKMRGIIARKLEMKKRLASKSEALDWARDHKQKYKIELIEELPESHSMGNNYECNDERSNKNMPKYNIRNGRCGYVKIKK